MRHPLPTGPYDTDLTPIESFEEAVQSAARGLDEQYAVTEVRWFIKTDIDGVPGYRPKKASLRERFSVVRGPGGWAVDDSKTGDSASFRALDEVASWIEEVSGEKVE